MTELNAADATAQGKPGGRGRFSSWKIIAPLLAAVAALGGGAGYWFWPARQPPPTAAKKQVVEPVYFELKPFVVSVTDSVGTPHFVQLGLSLALSGSEADNAVASVMPELQEAMRETVLAFKVEDIVNQAGVERLRQAIVTASNRLLLRHFGAAETKRLAAGAPSGAVVLNVFFPTLIVE
jgi:flagellar basal body-associated protein FliL